MTDPFGDVADDEGVGGITRRREQRYGRFDGKGLAVRATRRERSYGGGGIVRRSGTAVPSFSECAQLLHLAALAFANQCFLRGDVLLPHIQVDERGDLGA